MSVNDPTLNQLIVGDGSLLATWDNNNPYINIKSGSLIVNTLAGQMFQIPLTKLQAESGEHLITGLTNGAIYYVAYSFVTAVSGNPFANYVSNTENNVPGAVPSGVVLNSLIPQNLGAIANVSVANNGGYQLVNIVFLVFDETTGVLDRPPEVRPYDPSGNYTLVLENFVDYDIACYAVNEIGQSLLSNSLTVEATNLPNAPVLQTVQSGANGQSLITWLPGFQNPGTGIDAYYIYQSSCAVDASNNVSINLPYSQVGTLNVTPSTPDASLNFVATGLTNGVLYSFKVSAYDNPHGEGAQSNALYGLPYLSATMNNFAVTPGNTSLQCNWSSATNQQFYNFSNPVTYVLDISGNGNEYTGLDLSFNITGLTNGQSYGVLLKGRYQIPSTLYSLINGVSQTVVGPIVEIISVPRTVPSAPTNINYISQTNSILTLTWNVPVSNGGSSILGYNVNRYLDPSFNVLDASFNDIQALELTMINLTPINYWFKVFALNVAGSSVAATAGPFVPFDNILPPTNVSLVQTGTDNAGPIMKLTWTSQNTSVYTATAYSYYQCEIDGTPIGSVVDVLASAFDSSFNNVVTQYNYVLNGVLPTITSSSTYYYRIQAVQDSPYFISDNVQVSAETGALPVISNIYIDGSYNIVFTVDANGSALISLLVLAPPTSYVGSPIPYQLPIPDATTDEHIYTVTFNYVLANIAPNSNPQQFYLISATNLVGCAVSENFA